MYLEAFEITMSVKYGPRPAIQCFSEACIKSALLIKSQKLITVSQAYLSRIEQHVCLDRLGLSDVPCEVLKFPSLLGETRKVVDITKVCLEQACRKPKAPS